MSDIGNDLRDDLRDDILDDIRHGAVLEARALNKHYPVSTGFLKPKALVRALDGV